MKSEKIKDSFVRDAFNYINGILINHDIKISARYRERYNDGSKRVYNVDYEVNVNPPSEFSRHYDQKFIGEQMSLLEKSDMVDENIYSNISYLVSHVSHNVSLELDNAKTKIEKHSGKLVFLLNKK